MKKILFLILICLIKLNAYEYLIYNNVNADPESLTLIKERYYLNNESGVLGFKQVSVGGNVVSSFNTSDNRVFYNWLYDIRKNFNYFISNVDFQNIYKNDYQFLNDLYEYRLNPFLNYLYNNEEFNSTNYLLYDNYELLYNNDGLAVESIVDGVWAGLYSDNQKSNSGALYDRNGSLVYYNGKAVDPVTSFLVWLQSFTNRVVLETFEQIKRSLITGIIMTVVLTLALLRFVLEFLPSSIISRRWSSYGGGRGSLPDHGDGSQVAASVRARLASKNKALKERANGGSSVQQSMVNGILFDLENDR